MFNCPSCGVETRKLIAPSKDVSGKVCCEACYRPIKKFTNCNLGQTLDKWTGPKGETHRVTTGKRWEMEQRRVSKADNFTVINKATGKLPEY